MWTRNNDLKVAEYKTLAETKKANQLARENAESKQELKETMIKQIAAEKELADMYEELKIVENVDDLGKNVKKLETMVRKGPDNPKGIMSAKNYREKIVIPFIDKMYDAFKNVVKFAKLWGAIAFTPSGISISVSFGQPENTFPYS